jgi:hypothetical protein
MGEGAVSPFLYGWLEAADGEVRRFSQLPELRAELQQVHSKVVKISGLYVILAEN